jgi:hypothetical protein
MITAISDLATRKIAGKQYLAPKQLAELLGVRLSSIYEWDAAGALPKRMQVGLRRLRFFGQWDKLKADRSKEA